MNTAGEPVRWSSPDEASVIWLPVTMTRFLSNTGWPSLS